MLMPTRFNKRAAFISHAICDRLRRQLIFISCAAMYASAINVHASDTPTAIKLPQQAQSTALALRDNALKSDLAWTIVASLTTDVGPRLGGSEAEQRARDWAVELGKSLKFDRVSVEPFSMPYWQRGALEIELQSPYRQALYGTALGGSGASAGEINAELVYFRNFDELSEVADNALAGKIAYVDGNPLVKSQTGAGYSSANMRRRFGWQHAERANAKALVIRSVGSDLHRFPHTGMMSDDQGRWAKIPVVAISNPDADHLRRLHEGGKPLSLKLSSSAKFTGTAKSGNVVFDLVGRERPEEIVLIGGHLDSWDLGTGAVDDGAGVAITTAAAALIAQLPQRPRRTIRVVLFGAEENGILGARAYAEQHQQEIGQHVIATESDFGADTIWRLRSNVAAVANPYIDAMAKLMQPLGVVRGAKDAPWGGPDIIPLAMLGVPTVSLDQNGMDYFDLHHTPDDTLDKIDHEKLAQNVAAYVVFTYLAAELEVDFRKSVAENPKLKMPGT